jgi:hypothetical protein
MKFLVLSLLLVLGAFTAVAQEEADEGSLDDTNGSVKCLFVNNSGHPDVAKGQPAIWHFTPNCAPFTLDPGETKESFVARTLTIQRRLWAKGEAPAAVMVPIMRMPAEGVPEPPQGTVSSADKFQVTCSVDVDLPGYVFVFDHSPDE